MNMKTPAISSLPIVSSASESITKSSDNASGMRFDQALSQEMADRKSMSAPSKADSAEKPAAVQNTPAAKAGAKATKSASAEDGQASAIDENKIVTAADGGTEPAEQTDKLATVQEYPEAALAAASDELLALVASLQPAGVFASRTADAAASEDMAKATTGEKVAKTVVGEDALRVTLGEDAAQAESSEDAARAALSQVAVQNGVAPSVVGPVQGAVVGSGDAKAEAGTAVSGGVPTRAADAAHAVSPEQHASIAAGSNPNTPDSRTDTTSSGAKFDASLAQATDTKAASRANVADGKSGHGESAAGTPSLQDLRATKPAQESQAVAPINMASAQAPLQQMPAVVPQAAGRLAPHVGSPGWDQALGQRVAWMVGAGQQTASLTLNPPDLGPLQVVLNVSNSEATVNFTAAQPEVRQALEASMPKLREMLGEAGIQLGNANVGTETPNSRQNMSNGQQPHPSTPRGDRADSAPEPTVRAGVSQIITGGKGLVDTFA